YSALVGIDEERYGAVLAALPVIAGAAALARREASIIGTVLAALVLGRAVATDGLYPQNDPFSFFYAPARHFFTRVLNGQVATHLPFDDHHTPTTIIVFALIGGLAAIVAQRGLPPAGRVAVIATVTLVVAGVGVAAAQYNARHFVDQVGLPGTAIADEAFVDH